MRALHTLTFADHRFPKDFSERGEKHCYAARKAALARFTELFPFLPKDAKPLSWQTKGGRSRSPANATVFAEDQIKHRDD